MANETEKQKVKDFVDHLLSNPNIRNEPILIGEGLLLNFIVQNINQLKATFKTPQFFPHLEWNKVLQLILSELFERVTNSILPLIKDFIDSSEFEFFNKIQGARPYPDKFHKEKLIEFIQSNLKNKDVRYNFNSTVNIFKYKVIEKYITEIFNKRGYLYNELVRVQKNYLESEEYVTYLKVLLLIKNTVYNKISINPDNAEVKINFNDCLNSPPNLKKFIDGLTVNLRTQLPNITEQSIKLALKSNMRESQTELEDASSRFLYILTSRYQNFKPVTTVDRGAESPDKSWFGIARKNAEYYGYDKRMIEELYRIAGDNNW